MLDVDTIEEAHAGFEAAARQRRGVAFGLALLASGLSSSSVGTYAGQVVMQGFIQRSIPLLVRRLVTMTPALIVLAIGLDPTKSLVISQVVLSFGIPFALVPLVLLTRRRDIMGAFANARATTIAACVVAAADHRAEHVPAVQDLRRLVTLAARRRPRQRPSAAATVAMPYRQWPSPPSVGDEGSLSGSRPRTGPTPAASPALITTLARAKNARYAGPGSSQVAA